MATAGERYYNYEVHTTPERWYVRIEKSDGEWVENDILDEEDSDNVANHVEHIAEWDDPIADTLTINNGAWDYGFAGQFLWDETLAAIDAAVVAHEL
jgi:hypothetical protein